MNENFPQEMLMLIGDDDDDDDEGMNDGDV